MGLLMYVIYAISEIFASNLVFSHSPTWCKFRRPPLYGAAGGALQCVKDISNLIRESSKQNTLFKDMFVSAYYTQLILSC